MLRVLVVAAAVGVSRAQGEPNPPVWPSTVHVFSPSNSTDAIERIVQTAYVENGGREDHGQFSADHFAFLFMPGTYHADVPVGYYTQVLGLGSAPSDVVFDGDKGVYCEEGDYDIDVGALDTFWRSAENFETRADHQWTDVKGMLWAVSQAAPLRRLLVSNNLKLYEYRSGGAAGYASGGYLGNSVVRGIVASGSQQQWLTRSSNIAKWEEGVWNMVFVGVDGAPTPHCGQDIKMCQNPYVVVEKAPLACEKPFISVETTIAATCRAKLISLCSRAKKASKGNCFVCTGTHQLQMRQAACGEKDLDAFCDSPTVPPASPDGTRVKWKLNIPIPRRNSVGADIVGLGTPSETWQTGTTVDFSSVYVAAAERDSAASINAKLAQGLHVVLSPGNYELEDTLRLVNNGQVLLGLGLPTLVPTQGTAAVTVAGNTTGVRVAGLLLEAGTKHSPTLLQWGDPAKHGPAPVHDADWGFMHDVFARVGGPRLPSGQQARAGSMMTVDSSGVVGDNFWLWRADHVQGGDLVRNGDNPVNNGAIINGDDVYMYALAAEHTLQTIVKWNGERGKTFFFQAELPYDVNSYPYAGYALASNIKEHEAVGVGVYHFFRDYPVTVRSGITAPATLVSSFVDPFGVFLNGKGVMLHIINDLGRETKSPGGTGADPAWVCGNSSSVATGSSLRPESLDSRQRSRRLQIPDPSSCVIGGTVLCPNGGGSQCAGNECCAAGGTTCPSADPGFQCCPAPKVFSCNGTGPSPTPPGPPAPPGPGPPPWPPAPPSPTHCAVGATVLCPGTISGFCAGSQCCRDGSTCPSAPDSFRGCQHPKTLDCTGGLQ